MDLYVFNKNLEFIDNVDMAKSVIIAKKYNKCGDFEIYMSAALFKRSILAIDNYIAYGDFLGIIETIKIETDFENGNHVTISGRNIESVLSRRIIMNQTVFTGTVENYIRKIVNDNCINPSDPDRRIPQIVLGAKKGFSERIEIQCSYENLLDHIIDVCSLYRIGFKMVFDENNKKFVFELYKGVDRSVSNAIVLPVIFSKEYDNLLSTEYEKDTRTVKNVALVAGEGEGADRKKTLIGRKLTGLNRRECFVDARELSTNNDEITQTEYEQQLREKGNTELSNCGVVESVEGAIVQNQFMFEKDFFLGDIVTIKNEYGITLDSRIVETDIVSDDSGFRIIPIFEKEDKSND